MNKKINIKTLLKSSFLMLFCVLAVMQFHAVHTDKYSVKGNSYVYSSNSHTSDINGVKYMVKENGEGIIENNKSATTEYYDYYSDYDR
jgi:hypothetical protein